MPTTYAHYKLGKEVRKRISDQTEAIMEEYPRLFQIGLHGPDLLFYYKVLSKNRVNSVGYRLHEIPGKEYFEKAAEVIKAHEYNKAYISYTLGFLCHFVLDATCHGFVNSQVEAGIADHLELEAELDREMLIRDGRNPERAILTGHLEAGEKNARVIQAFFPELTKQEVEKSISDMIFYLNLLVPKNFVKRGLLTVSLKLAGKYEKYKGLIINKEKNPACEAATNHLLELFEEAKEVAVRLLDEYVDYLYGIGSMDPLYGLNFDSRRILAEKEF